MYVGHCVGKRFLLSHEQAPASRVRRLPDLLLALGDAMKPAVYWLVALAGLVGAGVGIGVGAGTLLEQVTTGMSAFPQQGNAQEVTKSLPRDHQQQRTFQLPTATEVFNLRSKCASLGQQILDEQAIEPERTKDQVSHYDPRTNRCYVELTIHVADFRSPQYQQQRFLLDGQTKEMLASAILKKDSQHGYVFDKGSKAYGVLGEEDHGLKTANDYMDERMAGERN
jgi:hypothetical protein